MAKTKWPKLPHFLIPLFQCANVYLCTSKEEWNQAITALNAEVRDLSFNNGLVMHFCDADRGENLYLVGVFDGSVATLVHECAHACFYACDDAGVRVETNLRNETYCYLLDRMFSHFLPHLNKQE